MRLGLVLSSSNDKEIHVPFSSAARFSYSKYFALSLCSALAGFF